MTCTEYLSIIVAPLLLALNLGIFIGNFLSKVILSSKSTGEIKSQHPRQLYSMPSGDILEGFGSWNQKGCLS